MTVTEARQELEEREVYLVETDEPASFIGEYAGVEEGKLVFAVGPLAPLHIPPRRIVEWLRLT